MTQDRDRNPPATEDEDPFLARWSRRKQAARGREARPTDAASPADAAPSADADASGTAQGGESPAATDEAPAADPHTAAPVDDAELPPPESLGPDSDFSAYLAGRVSSGLRRAALRRLFSLPGFNVRDGLDDYDEDYTQFASLGDTVTADMKHHEERLRARREAAEREAGEDAAGADDTPGTGDGAPPSERAGGDDAPRTARADPAEPDPEDDDEYDDT